MRTKYNLSQEQEYHKWWGRNGAEPAMSGIHAKNNTWFITYCSTCESELIFHIIIIIPVLHL